MKQRELQSLKRLLKIYCRDYSFRDAEKLLECLTDPSQPSKKKAGRKPKYSEETLKTIRVLHKSGAPLREIADITGCLLGYVHTHTKDRSE